MDNFVLALPTIIAAIILFAVAEYYKRQATTVSGFYVMNRGANMWLLTGTYVASWVSITGIMGWSSLAYRQGVAYSIWTYGLWGVLVFTFLVGLPLRRLAHYSDELVYRGEGASKSNEMAHKLLTPTDFFELRFPNRWVRGISSIMLVLGLLLYAVGQMMGLALAFSFLGVNFNVAVVICTLGIIWTTIRAGTPGVIVNDTINMFTFVIAAAVLIPFVLTKVGGIHNLIQVTNAMRPGLWTNLGSGSSLFTLISLNIIWNFMTAGSPHLVQRSFTAKNEKVFLNSQILGLLIVGIWCWLQWTSATAGNILLPEISVANGDNVLPLLALATLPRILAGLVLAAIFAVGISTINTQVSNIAFSLERDIYECLGGKKLSEEKSLRLTKIMVVACCIAIAVFAVTYPSFISEMTSWGVAFYGACFLPMFIFGLFWQHTTTQGVLAGISAGSLLYIIFGLLKLFGIFALPNSMNPFLITMPIGVLLIVIVSLLTKQSPEEAFVAAKVREIVKRKPELAERATAKDYAVPIAVIVVAITFAIVLFTFWR
ncbi:MAG: sodium:solute symporter family protein [Clostridiaceae bacterium]|nr:sodium:solute symporter family protein [Clostridiaceae bacterium]